MASRTASISVSHDVADGASAHGDAKQLRHHLACLGHAQAGIGSQGGANRVRPRAEVTLGDTRWERGQGLFATRTGEVLEDIFGDVGLWFRNLPDLVDTRLERCG